MRGIDPGVLGRLTTSGLLARVIVGLLIGFYVLLPLDRGFPTIPLFGRPLNPAIAATLGVLLFFIVQSRGAVLAYLREPYCLLQSIYGGLLIVGALRAPSLLSALHWALLYYCTFVLNYIIIRHVTRLYGTQWLATVVAILGIAAAGVGIVQGVIGIPLPMYDVWFENYFGRPPENYALATVRAAGTMNNPILYCVLMALAIPYVLDLPGRAARAVALFTIMFAAGLSGSRTTVFVVAVFALGALAVYRWRAVRALPAVAIGSVLLVASLGWLNSAGEGSRINFLVERSGFTAGSRTILTADPARRGARAPTNRSTESISEAEVSAALGISLRKGALTEGFREMTEEWGPTTWMIGRGSLTASSVGVRLQPWYTTVDNVFLSVLYERGITGLAVFIAAFLSLIMASRGAALHTLHWFAPAALAVAGLSFCWDAYSMFNILAVGSMAMAMWHQERRSGRGAW